MPRSRTGPPLRTTLAVARLGWGLVLLAAPDRVLALGGHPGAGRLPRAVARVLGGRHVAQAAVTLAQPSASVVSLGAATDALHSGTGLALAARAPAWRRIALADALGAAGWSLAGWRSRRPCPREEHSR